MVKQAPDSLARESEAVARLQLQGERLATPTCAAPTHGLWPSLQQTEQGSLGSRQTPMVVAAATDPDLLQFACLLLLIREFQRSASVSVDRSVDARAGAEEKLRDLGWSFPLCTEQQHVDGQKVAVASGPQLAQHLLLFLDCYFKYRFPWPELLLLPSDLRSVCTY